jgi:hypothetical protein
VTSNYQEAVGPPASLGFPPSICRRKARTPAVEKMGESRTFLSGQSSEVMLPFLACLLPDENGCTKSGICSLG